MSSIPPEPTKYDVQVFPFGQSGALGSDQWITWGDPNPNFTALTISFISGLAVKSIWFPEPVGPMSFYAGESASGTPFYVTEGNVAELVPIPNDAPIVTMTGPATPFFLYASSYGFSPFAGGTPPSIDILVTAPILNLGSDEAPNIGLNVPLPVIFGGSGSTDPSLIAGDNVTITGSWPNQQIDVEAGAGGVQSVSADAPLFTTGSAQNPTIQMTTPLPQGDGGTGIANPWAKGGVGIDVNSTNGVNDDSFQWIFDNTGVVKINPGDCVGTVILQSADGSVGITNPTGDTLDFSVNFPASKSFFAKATNPTPSGSGSGSASITLDPLPNGNWLVEAFVDGISAPTSDPNTTQAILTVNLGVGHVGWDATQYQRNLMIAGVIASGGAATPNATLTWTTDVVVNPHATDGYFWLKATRIN